MKTLILALVLAISSGMATADDSATTWVDTNSVLISHAQNPDIARRDCETTMRILSIMSNDKIVFQSMCEPAYNNPRCVYYYCYQLNAKALFINHRRVQE
ncbi:MAG: hypothetical protein WC635_06100 [Bacteriovorax sp.]|jgi:hypothetical protein